MSPRDLLIAAAAIASACFFPRAVRAAIRAQQTGPDPGK